MPLISEENSDIIGDDVLYLPEAEIHKKQKDLWI